MRVLRLQVRDADLRIVAPVDVFTSAEIVPKFNPRSVETCGTFEVELPTDSKAGRALLQPGAGVVASLDGVRFFSGLVEIPTRTRAGKGRSRLKVFGYSDDVLVAGREGYPVPGTDDLTAQDTVEADLFSGNAADGIRYYVGRNLGPTARPSARVPKFTVPTGPPLGTTAVGRARFHNLADLVSELALTGGGLGWRVLHVPGGDLVLQVFAPRDRSAHARFSTQLRNLQSYSLSTPKAKVTKAVAAGGGQGVNRRFRESVVSAAWHDFREAFVDRRGTGGGTDEALTAEELADVEAELDQAALEAVEQARVAPSFTAPVLDTPAVGFLRPDNKGGYGPLDQVTVTAEGEPFVDVVRQVSVTGTAAGVQIRATVGAPDAVDARLGPLSDLVRRLQAVERRQARIERSQ